MEELQVEIKEGKIKAPLKGEDVWLPYTIEEEMRQRFICKLVNEYGYNQIQMEQDVVWKEAIKPLKTPLNNIVIWNGESGNNSNNFPLALIVIECKAENVRLRVESYFQAYDYEKLAKSTFFVAKNQKEERYFTVVKNDAVSELQEILDIPQARDINNLKKIEELKRQLRDFQRKDFQRILFACHDIIRNNDKLSPEMAFDEISKILFIKIRHERKPDNGKFTIDVFNRLERNYKELYENQAAQKPYYQELFEQTKKTFENDEIFETTDVLRVRETSFRQIIEKLEKYNLSDTSDDVKGIAFEEFLGKTFRGDLGQFFTPRTIVNFMVSILDPQEGETICDPCCGTGGYLIKSFEHIHEKIENDIQQTKEEFSRQIKTENFHALSEKEQEMRTEKLNNLFNELNQELEPSCKGDWRVRRLSTERIYGTDAEPRSARTAKMNMIMHGDGHGGVHHHDGLLPVNGIFEERFDVILTNPPFGARVSREIEITPNDIPNDAAKIRAYTERYGEPYTKALVRLRENVGKPLISLFEAGEFTTLTEVVFVERCLRLLRKGGRMGVVLPEGFLNNLDLQRVREHFESRAKLLLVVSIPQDVFIAAGATVKPSLVFLKKFTDEEEMFYRETKEAVTAEINAKFQPEIDEVNAEYAHLLVAFTELNGQIRTLKDKLKKKDADKDALTKEVENLQTQSARAKLAEQNARKEQRRKLAEIQTRKQTETRAELKKRFDYEIPIVQVEKAGITSTGAKGADELPEVKKEFERYRRQKRIWMANTVRYQYSMDENGKLQRRCEKALNF